MLSVRLPKILTELCLVGLFVLFIPANVTAALVFSTPPRSDLGDNDRGLQSLVSYLEEVLGEPVIFDRPTSWQDYTRKMRSGKYDIVFDAPHFSSWRIKHIDHEPVVRVPGTLGYKLVVNRISETLNSIGDLVRVKICAPQSPNLSTMTVYSMFTNPVNMPQIKEIKGGSKAVYTALRNGKCGAAVIPNDDFMRIVPSEKREVRVVAESDPVPAYTITISPRLLEKKMLMTRMLVSAQGIRATAGVMLSLGKRDQSLIPVDKRDYQDLDQLLSDVILGW
jgi:ABC-type phosphate/phosphonate transport system substrate-binding protein